jgi:hypothetical protein
MAAKRKPKRKRGGIGTEIFETIERMIAGEKIGRTEAFRRLSSKTGRQQGTIAANYYRVAKQRGAKIATRRRRGAGGTGATHAVVKRALGALEEATALFRKLEEEIVQLRKENLRLAAIRRLIGR